ncbi:MAG TPA: hypothetical protein VNA88_05535 [Candidatus Kapabacteria bacterium]|nr:hypothetical protein [Candidatus Kapabacteria bacterium]
MNLRLALLGLVVGSMLASCGGGGGKVGDGSGTDSSQSSGAVGDASGVDGVAGTDSSAIGGVDSAGATAGATAVAKMNVNTATDAQLRTIPGVGDKMVHEFEEYRPYKSIVQFRKEIGKYVDEAQVATYENYLFVPIDMNESDMETITQIPGITMSEANQIVAARPYASSDAFFQKLGELATPEEIATARIYVAAP